MPHTVANLIRIGPKKVLLRAFGRIGIAALNHWEKWNARRMPTYQIGLRIDARDFPRFFRQPATGSIPPDELTALRLVCERYLNHEFDLLSSGWIRIDYGMKAKGLGGVQFSPARPEQPPVETVNEANREEAIRLFGLIDDPGYEPIDWHIAYRSGYRWQASAWCKDCGWRNLPRGVDIKEPWELCRMQHLVAMATVAATDPERQKPIAAEIRNQILDFIAHNPPGFGVNWACTMDVALRVSTWLIAHDLCRDAGVIFDKAFSEALGRSVHEHARFIATHLEWSDLTGGNHYLFDLIGLIFCCGYLPSTCRNRSWLSFALREFENQVEIQFNPDGGHIECSTAYHCFVSEAVAYTVSLLAAMARSDDREPDVRTEALSDGISKRLGLATSNARAAAYCRSISGQALSGQLPEQLARMASFIRDTIRPNGEMLLIGDNDSGWFVKLGTRYSMQDAGAAGSPVAEHTARGHIAALIGDLLADGNSVWLSGILPAKFEHQLPAMNHVRYLREMPRLDAAWRFSESISLPSPIPVAQLVAKQYSDFGLVLLQKGHLYVSLRTLPAPRQLTGHKHDDLFSVTVTIGREHPIDDPGIPCYTSIPSLATTYRSREAHFAPRIPSGDPLVNQHIELCADGVRIANGSTTVIAIQFQRDELVIGSDYPLPRLDKDGRFAALAPARAYGTVMETAIR